MKSLIQLIILSVLCFLPGFIFPQSGGSLNNNFSVSAQGGANYSLDLVVPPGLQGLSPNLSIAYSSQGGNGVLGQGFSLQGLSAITRISATPAQDKFKGGINYDSNDRFSLDGRRLMNINKNAGDYDAAGSIYATEVETWTKIIANQSCGGGPCSFTVIMKNGVTMEYGFTSDSRVEACGESFESGNQEGVVRKWLLNKVTDLNGNYVTYQYTSNPTSISGQKLGTGSDSSQVYIESISYTGNQANDPQRFVKFYYENRPDSLLQFLGGGRINTTARLTTIITQISLPTNEVENVFTYSFLYDSESFLGTSRLIEIKLTNSNGESLPSQTFEWSDGVNGFDRNSSVYSGNLNNDGWVGDYNGDGLTDLLTFNSTTNLFDSLYFSKGTMFSKGVAINQVYLGNLSPHIADFNADGLADIIGLGLDTAMVWLCNGSNFDPPVGVGKVLTSNGQSNVWLNDFNGDGRADIFLAYGYSYYVYLSNGKTYNQPLLVSPDLSSSLLFGDFNGDGMVDIYSANQGGTDSLYYSNFSKGTNFLPAIPVTNVNYSTTNWISDFNKDGLDDLLFQYGYDEFLSFGNGNGFNESVELSNLQLGDNGNWIGDFNGDGLTDIFVNASGADSSVLYLYQNGIGFQATGKLEPLNLSAENVWIGDFNGDGSSDIFSPQLTPLMLLSSNSSAKKIQQNHLPNLLLAIENGIGGRVDISYLPITDNTVYQKSKTGSSKNAGIEGIQLLNRYSSAALSPTYSSPYPIQPVQSATYVVNNYQISIQNQDSIDYYYTYEGAKIDLTGYGWLGFRSMSKIDSLSGRIINQQFHQLYPLTGTTHTASLLNLSDELMADELTTYASRDTLLSNNAKVYVVQETETTHNFYDNGQFAYALETKYFYDQFNNVKQTQKSDLSDPSNILYINNKYLNEPKKWQYGYLVESVYSSDSLGQNKLKASRSVYHPTTKNKILSQSWVSGNNWMDLVYLYDNFGNVTKKVNHKGDTSETVYDNYYHTFPTTYISPPNENGVKLSSQVHTDPRFGKTDTIVDLNGHRFVSVLDGFGRDSAFYVPNPAGDLTLYQLSRYELNENGGYINSEATLIDWQTPIFDTIFDYYDGLRRNTKTVSSGFGGKSVITDYVYDMSGKVVKGSYPYYEDSLAFWTTIQYDPMERITQLTQPISAKDSITYKGVYQGQTISFYNASSPDSIGTKIRFTTLNGNKCYTSTVDEYGDSIFFNYNLLGEVLTTSNNQFVINATTYDGLGRTIISDNVNLGKSTFTYNDKTGSLLQVTAKGDSIFTKQDALGRTIYQKYSNGDSLMLLYDQTDVANGLGRLGKVLMADNNSYKFSYSTLGTADSTWLNFEGVTYLNSETYNPSQNLIRRVYPNGAQQTYKYTAQNFLAAIDYRNAGGDSSRVMTYSNYLANGIPDQLLYGNGITLNEKSLLNGDITEISFTNNSNSELLSLVYKWNENLEIDTVQRTGGISELVAYNYDLTGRLLGANGTTADYSFGYDHLGNLIQQDSVHINYATFQPISVTNEQQDTLETYQYDVQGNLIEKRDYSTGDTLVWNYTYDLWNKLVSVVENGDTIQTYVYDYKGNLLKEKRFSDQVEILYPFDGYTITNQVGTITTEIDLTDGARIIAVASSTNVADETITYYHQNNVGSTVLTTNEAGQVVDEISYQPYGEISQWITTTDSSTNYLYGSKTYSSATDLYNFTARSYNPRVARFTTSDNQVGGNPWKIDSYNQYCYTLNSPIKNSDPSGHNLEEDVLFIGGTFLLGAEALAELLTDGAATPAVVLIDEAVFSAVEGTEGALDILDVVDISEEGTTVDEMNEVTRSSTGGDDEMEEDNQGSSRDGNSMSDDESSMDDIDDPDDHDWKPKSEQASKRSQYMGGTPGKNSPTGRTVIERMKGEGKIKKIGKEWRFLASDGNWYLLEDADMSHIQSAVSYWNKKGRFTGAKSIEVRMFMNDAGNYYLEYYRINRSEGGAMTARYLPPARR